MMLKQHDSSCRIVILLICIFLLVAVCSSSSLHQRIRRDTSKRNCTDDGHNYQAFCYGPRTDDGREDDVQRCFDKLYDSYKWNSNVGRRSENEGRCRCTVLSFSKRRWEETFRKARESIYRKCRGFTYHVMGSYEDDMRLIAICNSFIDSNKQ